MNRSLMRIDANVFRSILNTMDDGIVFLNTYDVVVYINGSAEKIRWINSIFSLGSPISPAISNHSKYIANLICELKNSSGVIHNHIIEEKGKVFDNSYYPVLADDGKYLGTMILSRDITKEARLKEETVALREQIHSEIACGEMVGNSYAMQSVFQLIHAVAAVDSTILILGESGTGKELVARAIHQHSFRKDRTLVKINCAALPESLLESELFGYEKGAFTGAVKDRKGKFEQAHGGTIFLDEIAEMPMPAQAKLLRVLQERTIERLGSNKEISVDVRIIAGTNKDLRIQIANGTFREDLFYRLNVIPINLPPLRERREDILPLAQKFLNCYAERMHKPVLEISAAAKNALQAYGFPGNVRELENTIERAVALTLGGELRLEHLPIEYNTSNHSAPLKISVQSGGVSLASNINMSEKKAIEEALTLSGNKKGEAAKFLGISRKTLWEKMKYHNMN